MGGSSERDHPKFKLYNLLSWTHKIFKVSNCKEKIKYENNWGYQNEGIHLQQGCQKFKLLATHSRYTKFSG